MEESQSQNLGEQYEESLVTQLDLFLKKPMTRKALVVGINRYPYIQDAKGKRQDLTYATADAEAIAQLLRKYGQFEVKLLPETFSEDAFQMDEKGLVKETALMREISELFNPTSGNVPETALLFFAGHGFEKPLPRNQVERYFAASDSNPKKGKWGIRFDWLLQELVESPVKNQIVWLDCCYSGTSTNLTFAQADPENRGCSNVNRLFIAACRESETAYGIKGHGLLTRVLLGELNPHSDPVGQWITSKNLDAFINDELRNDPALSTFGQRFRTNSSGDPINFWQRLGDKTPQRNFNEDISFSESESSHPSPTPNQPQQTYYTDIACPRRIWVKEQRFPVVVRLTLQPSDYSEALEEIPINPDYPVFVWLDAPQFNLLNPPAQQEIKLEPNTDSQPLVFFLQPQDKIGHTTLNFHFFQNGNQIGKTVTIDIEITPEPVSSQAQNHPHAIASSGTSVPYPDLMLYIQHQPHQLQFTLFRDGGFGYDFKPIPLQSNLETYAASIYDRLNNLMNPRGTRMTPVETATNMSLDEIDKRLKKLGQKLWDDLIPTELQELYSENRDHWSERTFLLVTDDPYIPWELVFPYSSQWEDEVPWCITFKMTRWLRKDQKGNGNEVAPPTLSLKQFACIAPPYAKPNTPHQERFRQQELPHAQQEQQFLRQLIAQHKLEDVTPISAHSSAIIDLLENANSHSSYTWLHIAAHGNFYSDTPDDPSAIHLEDNTILVLDDVRGKNIEQHLENNRPAFFFNACDSGRQSWALTGLGGWSNHLIKKGAGLVLAPLWKVNDYSASQFAKIFYSELLEGKTVAEAIRNSRLATKQQGHTTWLAYSVYAHPNAKISELA